MAISPHSHIGPQYTPVFIPTPMPMIDHLPPYAPRAEQQLLPRQKKKSFRQKVLSALRYMRQIPQQVMERERSPSPRPSSAYPVQIEPVPPPCHHFGYGYNENLKPLHRDFTIDFSDYRYPPFFEAPKPCYEKSPTAPEFMDDEQTPKRSTFFEHSPRPTAPDFIQYNYHSPQPPTFFEPEHTHQLPELDIEDNITFHRPIPVVKTLFTPFPSTSPLQSTAAAVLLGPDKRPITFKQGTIGDCYLLAGLDSILHHPAAEQLLNQITIQTVEGPDHHPKQYTVRFPSGLQSTFDTAEVGMERDGKKPLDGPHGMQLLELAYAKSTRSERNRERGINAFPDDGRCHTPTIVEEGLSERALSDMYGGETIRVDSVDNPPSNFLISGDEPLSANVNAVKELKALFSSIAKDTRNNYILTAATPQFGFSADKLAPITILHLESGNGYGTYERKHSYSIRSFDPKARTITIANPHDTASQVRTISLNEFCSIFRAVSGVKLPK